MEDKGIFFDWYGAPCSCRCDHCLLAAGAAITRVPYEDAKAVAARYLQWRKETRRDDFLVSFSVGYSMEFPQMLDCVTFCMQNEGRDFFQVGGVRKRTGDELQSFLNDLKRTGIRRLGLSFHGVGKAHDACTHRRGDFNFLMDLARVAIEIGLKRHEQIFLRRSTLGQLPSLLVELDSVAGLESRSISPFDYRGRGKLLEEERPFVSDLDKLPAQAINHINRKTYKPELEWVQAIMAGKIPTETRRYYRMPIHEDSIRQLQAKSPENILALLRETEDAFKSRIPSLQELARRYGDPKNQRLYAVRDLRWKWTDAYLAEHPTIDRTGVFDDLKPCVMCK